MGLLLQRLVGEGFFAALRTWFRMQPNHYRPAQRRSILRVVGMSVLTLTLAAPVIAAPRVPMPAPSVIFRAPADRAPAGPLNEHPSLLVLPSGRFATPTGLSVHVPFDAANLVLTPGGRYAITVSSDPRTSALCVVDTETMSVVSTIPANGAPFSGGLAIVKDLRHPGKQQYLVLASEGAANAVAAFNLSIDGRLTPDARPAIALGPPQTYKATTRHYAGNIIATAQRAYVVDELGRSVWEIDVPARTAVAHVGVGFSPRAIALRGHFLAVSNEGVGDSRPLPHDLGRASSVNIIPLDAHGGIHGSALKAVAMDQTPVGAIVGGAHPSAIAINPENIAFVAMAGVDRIASVSMNTHRVIGGSELRLFDHGPYGTQPVSLALDNSRKRLYVALSGIDAVAVMDVHEPSKPHRLGLIPTGDHPTSVALSADGASLYVSSLRGRGETGLLERIDLAAVHLPETTARTLANLRRIEVRKRAAPTSVATRIGSRIQTVIQIRMPAATFDEVFGQHNQRFSSSVMPNVHHLARHYAMLSGLYAPSDLPLEGIATALGGQASAYTVRTALAGAGRRPIANPNALTPDDATRFGLIFDQLRSKMMGYEILSDCRDSAVPCVSRFVAHLDNVLATKKAPAFIALALPDPAGSAASSAPVDAAAVAKDDDAALGLFLGHLATTRLWKSSLIVISPWRTDNGKDHINRNRVYGIVVSPFTATGHVDGYHRTLPGILKTEEELLNLQPLSLGELLSTDFSEIFTSAVH